MVVLSVDSQVQEESCMRFLARQTVFKSDVAGSSTQGECKNDQKTNTFDDSDVCG